MRHDVVAEDTPHPPSKLVIYGKLKSLFISCHKESSYIIKIRVNYLASKDAKQLYKCSFCLAAQTLALLPVWQSAADKRDGT